MTIAVQIITLIAAVLAAFISFQNFRLSGRKRLAEFRHDWLNDVRGKLAEMMLELNKVHSSTVDGNRISYLMEYLDLMLDMRKTHHKALKNTLMPTCLAVEGGSHESLEELFDKLGHASRNFIATEQDDLESEIKRYLF